MTDYTTVPQVRAAFGSTVTGAGDDEIARTISAVSRWLDRFCNQPDGFVAAASATARLYAGDGTVVQRIDPCIAVTLIETRAETRTTWESWAGADWIAFRGDARQPDFNHLPYTGVQVAMIGARTCFPAGTPPTVRITARWGYADTPPDDIAQACIIQVARLFKRGEGAFADALSNNISDGALSYRRLDPEVEAILKGGRYVRPA